MNRKKKNILAIAVLLLAITTVITMFISNRQGETKDLQKAKNMLIAYFSHSGNTREMAKLIQKQVGGDLFEITTIEAYPTDYKECVALARKENKTDARPALASEIKNIEAYDTIFIGYPLWVGTMPMALFTFLEKYDMSGKTIIPFCTYDGGRWGRSLDDIKKLCPNATILEGLAVAGNVARGVPSAQKIRRSKNDIRQWLQKIGIINEE
jgi:flavodoxin